MPVQAFSKFNLMRRALDSAPSTLHLGDIRMFKPLPFGLCSSQDIFQSDQRVMSEMFEDIEGVEVVVDDIVVWGENKQQHDDRLIKVLERARLWNLKLNKTKCQMKKKPIYLLT